MGITPGIPRPGGGGLGDIPASRMLGNFGATSGPAIAVDSNQVIAWLDVPTNFAFGALSSTVIGLAGDLVDLETLVNTKADSNDSRLTNAREWTASTVSQAEAQEGTAATRRAFTAQRVRQAIVGWWVETQFETRLGAIWDATTNEGEVALYCDDGQWFFFNATFAENFRASIGAGTSNFDGLFASLVALPDTLAGYGITDALSNALFELYNQNMVSLPITGETSTGDRINSLTYGTGPSAFTRTFGYTGDRLTSITLSGAIPSGMPTVKTLTYTGNRITGTSYS